MPLPLPPRENRRFVKENMMSEQHEIIWRSGGGLLPFTQREAAAPRLITESTTVYAKLRFTALHNWPGAPDSHAYLRQPHRHEFHVEVGAGVCHHDRNIEFIDMKEKVSAFCQARYEGKLLEGVSCEMIANDILNHFGLLNYCKVEEDGENGAIITRTYEPYKLPERME